MQNGDTQEILEAIHGLDQKIGGLDKRMFEGTQEILEAISLMAETIQDVDVKTDMLDGRLTRIDTRLTRVEADMVTVKSTMVTKDYLDEKLGDLKGDMVAMVRKGDQKVNRLVGVLSGRKTISKTETKEILAIRPLVQS